jgi:HEAT repeat protein
MMPGKRRAALAALTCAMVWSVGCEQPDWTNPEYVKSQLTSPEVTKIRVAIGEVAKMDKDALAPYAKELTDLYMGDAISETERGEVMGVLLRLGAEEAKAAYIKELETNASGKAGVAAGVLADLKVKDALPAMLKVLEAGGDPDMQVAILQAMETMPDVSMLPALTKILQKDTDNTQIRLLSYACDILGDIALEKPAALSEDMIDATIVATFKTNAMGQNLARTCGAAVQKIGPSAVPKLVQVYKQENQAVMGLLLKYNDAKSKFGFPPLLATKRAGAIMTAMRAKPLPGLIVEKLDQDIGVPEIFKNNRPAYDGWNIVFVQTLEEQTLSLGELGAVEHKGFLVDVLRDKMAEKWRLALKGDPKVQTVVRQNAAIALSKLGDRSVADELLDAAVNDRIAKLEEVAKHFESKGQPMATSERYSFNVTAARAFAALATGADKEKYSKALSGIKKDEVGLRVELAKVAGMLATAVECDAAADKVACYSGKLSSGDEMVREKAVFELGMMPSDKAAPALTKALSVDSMATRELVEFFLYRHPTKDAIPAIDKLLEAQKESSDPAVRIDNNRLEALKVYITHHAK